MVTTFKNCEIDGWLVYRLQVNVPGTAEQRPKAEEFLVERCGADDVLSQDDGIIAGDFYVFAMPPWRHTVGMFLN